MASTMSSTNSGTASPISGSSSIRKGAKQNRMIEIPVVQKPDLEKYKTEIDTYQKEINGFHKKLDGINSQVNDLTKGNSDFQRKRDDLRKNLDTIQHQMDTLEIERNRLVSQIEDCARTGRDMKTKVQGLKRSLGFQTSEEIDAKIRQIERHMMSKRLTVPEENKLIAEIRSLEKSKPLVAKYANMEADANNHSQTAVLPLRIRLDEIKEELKVCQQKKRDLSESFGALMQKRSKVTAPVRELADERGELRQQIVEKRAQMNQVRDEMFKKQREYEAYQAKVDRVQRELKQEERKRRDLERQREDIQNELEDIDEETWSPELQLTNQTVLYLRKLVEKSQQIADNSRKNKEEEGKEDEEESVVLAVDNGMIAMKPKKYREEEYYFKPTKKKGEKKEKKQAVISLNQPIVHDIMTLADFSRLHVEAPLTLQDCPTLLKSLEEKLDIMKKEHSRNSETTQRRKAELLAKLGALEEPKLTKSICVSCVEVEAI